MLDVDAVVEGTVLLSGEQVRITAQLIDASADRHLWSQSYEGEVRDTLALQKKVARAIADQIRINVNPQERAALKSAKVVNSPHMHDEAVAELKKAVQLSGGSPTRMANLGRAYVASGERVEAEKLLHDLKNRSTHGYPDHAEIAAIYASLGDADQAMIWLEKGFQERFNPSVILRPGFDPLR